MSNISYVTSEIILQVRCM